MQLISGFIDIAAPFAYLLWLIPAALILYFLGWLVRGIELTSVINNHKEEVSSRELELKKLAVQLEKKEQLLEEIRVREDIELESTESLEHTSHLLQLNLNDARNEREQLHHDKTAALHKLDETIIQLEHTQRKLKKYEKAAREYEEKFSALKTKYKQRDAKLYGEIVELRAYIFDLKANNLKTEKERNEFRESAQQLEQVKVDSQSNSQAIRANLEESGQELEKLQAQIREQSVTHQTEVDKLTEQLKLVDSQQSTIAEKTEQLQQISKELDQERIQCSTLADKLQQITDSSQLQLRDYSSQQEKLTLKYNDLKIESRRETDALKAQVRQLQPLSTINKNQARTIRTIESKLEDHRKQADKFQSLAANLVSTQSELEKVTLRLNDTESTLEQNTDRLTSANDKLQQTAFENRKIPSLQNQLKEKDKQLAQLDEDLLKLNRALERKREDKSNSIKLSAKISSLKQQNDEQEGHITELNLELAEVKQLEDKLIDRDTRINQLQKDLEAVPVLQQQMTASETERDQLQNELNAQINKNKYIETQAQTIQELEEEIEGQKRTITQINKSLSSYREKADLVTRKDKALLELEAKLGVTQKTVQERNTEILSHKSELTDLGAKCQQIEPLQQALMQSEKKSKSIAADLNRARLDLAEAEKSQQDEPQRAALQQALDTAEANTVQLRRQLDSLQAQAIENDALHKRLAQLDGLQPTLAQAENRIKELDAELRPLKANNQKQANTVASLQSRIAELEPLQVKLAKSQAHASSLSSRIDQHISTALAVEPLEQQIVELKQELGAASQAERLANGQSAALSAKLEKLEKSNEHLRAMGVNATDQLKALKKQQQDELEVTRKSAQKDADSAVAMQQQIDNFKRQLQQRDASLQELRDTIAARDNDNSNQGADGDTASDELAELRKQLESLTRERDLGLDRVKELSESARSLVDKEKMIKQLKLEAADARINQRELDTLRVRIERSEQEIQTRNLAIEDLKKMLRDARKPQQKVLATGPSVKKTPTVRRSARSAGSASDDLKKIRGIGPVLEKLLNENGITRFQQIAEFTARDIERVSEAINTFPGRVTRDDWIGGAKKEYRKKYGKSEA